MRPPGVLSGRHWSPDELHLRKYLGIALAVSGNLLISGALNVQKHVHNKNAALPPALQRDYTRIPLWWVGFVMTLFGEIGNFAAYGFAEASLVTPLGAVSVVSNAFIAAIVLNEGLRLQDLCGCVLVVGGSAMIAATTSLHQEYLDPALFIEYIQSPVFIAYSIFLFCAIALIYSFRGTYGHKYVWYYVLLCSLIGSITVMASKGLSSFFNSWAFGGALPLVEATPYVLLVVLVTTAVLQVKYLNLAMRHFGNTETVPVFYVLFTLCTIVASSILYRDFQNDTPQQIIAFCSGCLVTFAGALGSLGHAGGPPDDSALPMAPSPRRKTHHLEPRAHRGRQDPAVHRLPGGRVVLHLPARSGVCPHAARGPWRRSKGAMGETYPSLPPQGRRLTARAARWRAGGHLGKHTTPHICRHAQKCVAHAARRPEADSRRRYGAR